jgi:C_GCAxxG_C_C family probable redox protein
MNMQNDAAVKAVGAFGGGIASSGSVCGALLGGIAMISSIYSRASLDEKENPRVWALSTKFMRQFEELTKDYGGINCRDIAGIDWKDRDAVKEYYANPESSRKVCVKLVGDTAYALGLLLEREAAGQEE